MKAGQCRVGQVPSDPSASLKGEITVWPDCDETCLATAMSLIIHNQYHSLHQRWVSSADFQFGIGSTENKHGARDGFKVGGEGC